MIFLKEIFNTLKMEDTYKELEEQLFYSRKFWSIVILISIILLSYNFNLVNKFNLGCTKIVAFNEKERGQEIQDHYNLVFFPIISLYLILSTITCFLIRIIKPLKLLIEPGLISYLFLGLVVGLLSAAILSLGLGKYSSFYYLILLGGAILGFIVSFLIGLRLELKKEKTPY